MRKLLLFAAAATVVFGACGGGDDNGGASDKPSTPPKDGEAVIGVKGLEWNPDSVTVEPGTTVRWKWDENLAHNLKSESDEKFEVSNSTKADYTHTFDEPGTYKFACDLHPGMDGTVEVEE